jgi:hypothetical protein
MFMLVVFGRHRKGRKEGFRVLPLAHVYLLWKRSRKCPRDHAEVEGSGSDGDLAVSFQLQQIPLLGLQAFELLLFRIALLLALSQISLLAVSARYGPARIVGGKNKKTRPPV